VSKVKSKRRKIVKSARALKRKRAGAAKPKPKAKRTESAKAKPKRKEAAKPQHARPHPRHTLQRLLALRNEHPERLTEIDGEIHAIFAKTHAVMVLDMCGFSRLTARYGITHFLAMIHRLHGIVAPIIATHGGTVVKTEADNVFAVFPDVGPAVAAAIDIQDRLREANVFLPDDWDLHASLGIGYGQLLMVGDDDLYGHEMNIASKLGEDIAGSGEVFLSDAAYARVAALARPWQFEARQIPVSAMVVTAHKLRTAS
jgi:adenylate cyclase